MKRGYIGQLGILAAMMMAVSDGKSNSFYKENKIETERKLTDKEKAERHRMYGGDQTMHEYVINGVKILATNKKTAKKIYQKRKAKK